ncbi:hypothetical protein BDZ85DRAFT_260316 [Elsinoe ampelina]|uniref:Uncharacterized protein n=1 Tax=Elsinoe ampelina TaxID=302913 RepID=A0A6A6GEA6_9PEZI|nr:hypothetical protein BDZ85DRAFT_260316 [Elsinoe ampelina]
MAIMSGRKNHVRSFQFDALPDEILVEVISHLDATPPLSESDTRRLPHEEMFLQPCPPIKMLSRTSKRWRRVTLPVLFRHLYIDLDNLIVRTIGTQDDPLEHTRFFDSHHDQLFLNQLQVMLTDLTTLSITPYARSLLVLSRASAVYHALRKVIDSAMPQFWRSLLSTFPELQRIVLLAPFLGLASLTSCVDSSFLASAQYHSDHFSILELTINPTTPVITSNRDTSDYGLATKSPTDFRFKLSSLMHMRSWTHIGLNEGNIGELAEQYEHEASATTSLLPFLFPPCCLQQNAEHSHRWAHLRDNMTFLDSFAYTALCVPPGQIPSSRYTTGVHPFKFVRKLDMKLLPDLRDAVQMMNDLEDEDEVEDFLRQHDDDVATIYADLRSDMTWFCNDEGWRWGTLVSDDHEWYRRCRGLVEAFEESQLDGFEVEFMETFEDPATRVWAREWRVVEDEGDEGVRKKVVFRDQVALDPGRERFDDVGDLDLHYLQPSEDAFREYEEYLATDPAAWDSD